MWSTAILQVLDLYQAVNVSISDVGVDIFNMGAKPALAPVHNQHLSEICHFNLKMGHMRFM